MTNPAARINQWAETSRRLIDQASTIVLDANTQISNGTFSAEQWARSAQKLADLALTTGLNLVPQLAPLLCLPPDKGDLSDFITVAPDSECQRILSVVQPFVQEGAPTNVIPTQAVFFAPPLLRVHATTFRVGVNWPNLRSGTYRGQLRLTRVGSGDPSPHDMVVTIDL